MVDSYWAAAESKFVGEKLMARVTQYDTDKSTGEFYLRLRSARQYYYGFDPSGVHATSGVLRGGEQGELAQIRVNHSRALVNTLLNLVISPKITWQPKAVNNDYAAAGQCILASAILEYYWKELAVEKFAAKACEEAIAFTEGFVFAEWDESMGEDLGVDPETDSLVKSGDIRFTSLSSWDVIRDPRRKSWDALDWVILKVQRNKWDLARLYPNSADDIIMTEPDPQDAPRPSGEESPVDERDDLTCYYFFHKPTPSLPAGREVIFISDTCVLVDRPLSYDTIPLHRVAPSEMVGTPFGYTQYLEVLGIQELIDSLHTSIATNQSTFSTQLIAIETGSEVQIDQLTGGAKAIYYPPGKSPPQALQLCKSPPEVFTHVKDLKQDQEQLFGLNSVVRGTPQGSSRSGAALALLQSQAILQASGLQSNYLRFVEGLGAAVLHMIQTRAAAERRIAITGKSNAFLQSEETYTGQSINKIRKVSVDIGNPLAQTAAGRSEIAKELIQLQLIKTHEQYQQVLATGQMEPLTQSLENELLLISSENEEIAKGQPPKGGVLLHDDHLLHCREHRPALANPMARTNPEVLKSGTDHIHEHYKAFFGADPVGVPPQNPMDPMDQGTPPDPQYRERMLFLMGLGPMPPPMGQPGAGGPPPGAGGPPHPGGPPPQLHPGPPQQAGPGAPLGGPVPGSLKPGGPMQAPQAGAPINPKSMPREPKNPATGQKWEPLTGGGIKPT